MPWSKKEQESYDRLQEIREYMIDCVVCECPITPKERDEYNGRCNYCYKVKKAG